MEYLSVAQARDLPGLRLVLTTGTPGPWGEAAKAMFRFRNVPFAPVAQTAFAANQDVLAWTGIRNAPIAMYEDEPPCAGWLEIALLAERIGSGPSLFPERPLDRALAIGLTTEIASEEGLGWARRLQIFTRLWGSDSATQETAAVQRAYRFTQQSSAAAAGRIISILDGLAEQFRTQRAAGSNYLVGDKVSLCDLCWATFSIMLVVPSRVNCPMADYLVDLYSHNAADVAASIDPALLAHSDRILEQYIGLPMDF